MFCVVTPTFLVLLGYQVFLAGDAVGNPHLQVARQRRRLPGHARDHRLPGLPPLGGDRPCRAQAGRASSGTSSRSGRARATRSARRRTPNARSPRWSPGSGGSSATASSPTTRRRRWTTPSGTTPGQAPRLPRAAHRRAGRRLQPGLPDRDRGGLPAAAGGAGARPAAHLGLTRTPALRPDLPVALRARPARRASSAAVSTVCTGPTWSARPTTSAAGCRRPSGGGVDHWLLDPPVLWDDADAAPPLTHLHSNWFSDPQTRPYAERLLLPPAGSQMPGEGAGAAGRDRHPRRSTVPGVWSASSRP